MEQQKQPDIEAFKAEMRAMILQLENKIANLADKDAMVKSNQAVEAEILVVDKVKKQYVYIPSIQIFLVCGEVGKTTQQRQSQVGEACHYFGTDPN